jgi:RHS repeat-associated protein
LLCHPVRYLVSEAIDTNVSLISDSVKTYTYDAANRLVQVSDQSSVVSMDYNGLGQRLSMDAAGVIAHYVMDGDQPLTAESAGNTTFYLYGLGAIAEKTNAWSYSLPDGTNTPRQISNLSGDITLSARYTPWGDTLDTHGTGNFTFGYFGGLMDVATELLYVGNGQYYDPATGRFLTRDAKPNNTNPYVPWDPTGAIIGPLAAMALFFGRKRKRNKRDILIIIVLLGITAGTGLVACGPAPAGTPPPGSTNTEPPLPVSTQTPVPVGVGTSPSNIPSTATPPIIPPLPDCPTATFTIPTPIGTPTPTPLDAVLETYGVRFIGNMAEWTSEKIDAVRNAVIAVAERMAQVAGGGRSPLEVFRLVFKGVNFSWGTEGATGTCATIEDGACTSGPNNINFVDWLDGPERGRNNVVHELGHAFSKNWSETAPAGAELEYFRQHPEETNPVIVLAWAQSYAGLPEHYVPGFPDRQNPTDNRPGDFLGFASQQNVLTWQMAVTNAGDPGEEFADQFLGWTFDTWERNPDGSFTDYANMRRNFMDKYMPGWITYRINH